LIAGEEEELVFVNRPAECTAELIPLQRVTLGCKEISGVESVIAQKFEGVAMKGIAAALGNHVDHAAGLRSVIGGQRTGLHFKFLERVRKRHRQPDIRNRVHVVSAVQQKQRLASLPARHRECHRRRIVLVGEERLPRAGRHEIRGPSR
jgi:hypothetical protein